ncbi:glycohydrolase toxin TNT-related protein [Ralstonia solanacearum]|nr:glycohydrolase toxin TNT-related protein [Ralstonia solanacearum]MDC6178257.1 glycohydrolase toxin TNT-related protein [Ralstonia solanacearum]MDC6210148.1 glycohydrolase toxin TNT-related protein [Ralstonia solanacearum]MDC6240435.1 glycohydrolase toxin TNT-related protein [Ralstonia solanacearum]MDD7801420.1 glycohydrolase toxin TNT-related protein [Ralstonia solanacearum]
MQVSWQAARQSAATIALHGATVDSPFTSWLTTGRLLVRWSLREAQAGAITDPTAPIRFTPTLTQTTGQGGGVPVVNVTTPNPSGLSYNLLRSLTVDGIGLILNNSLAGGGTLLGGNVGGNANLATSGPASTILTQVTGTDPIRINGTVEVFGTPASVILAAPAGIYTQGGGFTNTPRVTLSSGTPQFLNGSGANVPFDQASAVGFLVNSGRIQIDPAAGSTAGAGIEGTVGAINLIGQTVGVNAPLFAGNQINVIAGNQQVAPVATGTGRAGSDWQVSSTGANAAANSASAQNGLAIDATAFGAMTAGQIKLISTAQGLGVRAAGDLAANTGNVNIDANGDVSVGNVYGQQAVGIATTGAVTASGAVRAQQDVTIGAGGDLTIGGAAQAGNNLTLNAGGKVAGAGTLTASKAIDVQAGGSIDVSGNVNANRIAMQAAGRDGLGDIRLGGNVGAPGTITLNAARDTTIAGSVVSDSDLNLATQRNLSVGGVVGSTKGNVSLTARTGALTTQGAVVTPGNLVVSSGTDTSLGGQVSAAGTATVNAGGNLSTAGQIGSNGVLTLNAGQNLTIGGQVGSGADAKLQAGSNVTVNGALISTGDTSVTAGQSIALAGDVAAGGNATLSASQTVTGPGNLSAAQSAKVTSGSIDLGGQVKGKQVALTANGSGNLGDVRLGGAVSAPGSVTISATRDATLGSNAIAGGDLTATAGRHLTVNGSAASTGGNVNLNAQAGQLASTGSIVAYQGDVNATAGQDLNVGGSVYAGRNAALAARGGNATVSGNLTSLGKASIGGGQNTTLSGQLKTGGDLQASAANALSVAQLNYVGGSATLRGNDITVGAPAGQSNAVQGTLDAVASRGLTLAGNSTANALNLGGATITNQGSILAAQQASVNGGTVTNAGTLAANHLAVNATDMVNRGTVAGQAVSLNAARTLDNAGGLVVGAQTLNVTAGALTGNRGGTFFGGDLTGKSPTTGDLTFTVNGGAGSFNNAGGQILAGNNLTLNTPNQAFDPSAATAGALNANNTLTLSVQSINNTSTWNVQGSSVAIHAAQGIFNSGTIQKAGNLSLSTGGTLANSGQIVGGANVALSAGTLTNTGTIHADGNLALAGNIRNAGNVEALGGIAVTGSDYDNRGGKTQANGDIRFDIGGTLNNVGSVIGANGNVHIAAQNVINDRTAPVDAGSSFGKVVNDALLNSTIIGSYAPWVYGGSCDTCSAFVPGTLTNATIGDLVRNPDGSIPLVTGSIPTYVGGGDNGASLTYIDAWHLGATPGSGYQSRSLALPTVDRTIVRQADGTAGQIVSRGALDITAALLSNQGGIIQAGKDITLNVGSLNNGRSATLVNSVTDAVNAGELAAFLAQINAIAQSGADGVSRTLMFGQPMSFCSRDDCGTPAPTAAEFALGTAVDGSKVSAPVQTTVTQTFGKAGQILSGGNLSLAGSGDLTNAGDIAAAGKVSITAAGTFTNQGTYVSSVTTTSGCLPGAITCREAGAHVDTLNYQQAPNTVAAGDTLTVHAANIQNLNGTLAAVGNVTLTAGNGVTNRAGAIQSTAGDVTIAAPTVVNTTMAPVTLHKSYGNMNPSYAGGCNAGGTYKESQCASDETTAAGPAGVISAARDVNLSGTTLTNNGALITGGRNVTVNMAGNVDNNSIALNANWYGHWVEETGMFKGDRRHETNGVAVLGNLASGIQAGNVLSVTSGGRTVNTGNLLGGTVDLSSAALVNGITSPTQPTPPSVAGQQVISLAPPSAPSGALPTASNTGTGPAAQSADATQASVTPVQTPAWTFQPAIVTTPSAPGSTQVSWHFNAPAAGSAVSASTSTVNGATYVNPNPATAVLAGVTPDSLLSQLPPALRPGGTPFYYDPFTENQKLQQAALAQTGQSSFVNGLTYDSQHRLSVTDQEKLILYGNAADYAKAHNIQLGQALTQQQIAQLDKPMLWYVTQQVPDPNCNTVASTACAMVSALVPQLYLPAGYADAITQPAGGVIAGTNVNVNVDGTLRNSGQITAADTLNVHAGRIDAAPNVVNVGTSAYKVEGGWLEVSGTQVQPGGFMSALHLNVTANSINAINEAFIVRNPDGTTNQAASDALVAQLKANLGLNYTSGTVKDDIHQNFIKEEGPLPSWVGAAVAVAISIVTAGAGAGLMAIMMAGMLSSAASQVLTTGKVNMGQVIKAGVVAVVTAGLTQGALSALNVSSVGASTIGNNIATGNWAAAQSSLGSYLEGAVVHSAISAGVNTVAYGGSFGQAFANGMVQSAAALGANAIGTEIPGIGMANASASSIALNVASHALLGCVAQSMSGGTCEGGAIGGATSAVVAPIIGNALGITTNADRKDPINRALVTGAAMLAGAGVAAALGQDAQAAAGAAQNEATNNYLSSKSDRQNYEKAKRECTNGVWSSCATSNIYAETDRKNNDALTAGLSNCQGTNCQELANWIQDQKVSYGCGTAPGSMDCQILQKGWLIAQSKAQGLELPAFAPDDLIGTGLIKGVLTGTLKGVGLLGVTRVVAGDAAKAAEERIAVALAEAGSDAAAIRARVLSNIEDSRAARASSNFDQYYKAEGQVQESLGIWPPNRGGYMTTQNVTLDAGFQFDRYGYPGGAFVAPVGTPFGERALPSSYEATKPYFQYEVLRPIPGVMQSKILPWFGQRGTGMQFELQKSVQWYLDNGFLKDVTKK